MQHFGEWTAWHVLFRTRYVLSSRFFQPTLCGQIGYKSALPLQAAEILTLADCLWHVRSV